MAVIIALGLVVVGVIALSAGLMWGNVILRAALKEFSKPDPITALLGGFLTMVALFYPMIVCLIGTIMVITGGIALLIHIL